MEKTRCDKPIDSFRTCPKRNCEHLEACSQKWQEEIHLAFVLKEPVCQDNLYDEEIIGVVNNDKN